MGFELGPDRLQDGLGGLPCWASRTSMIPSLRNIFRLPFIASLTPSVKAINVSPGLIGS